MEDRVSTQNGPKGRRRQTRYNLPLCEEKQWGKQNRGITTQGSTLTQIVTTGSVWARRGNKQWSLAKEHLRVPIKKAGIVGTANSLPTDIHPAYKSQKRSKSGGKDEAWPWGPMLPPLYEKQPNPRQGADCNREHMWLFARQLAWEAPENPEIKFHKEKKKVILMKSTDYLKLKSFHSWWKLLPHSCFLLFPPTPQIDTFSLSRLLYIISTSKWLFCFPILFCLS